MNEEFEIYKGKNFSGLCKDIVTNSQEKRDQLEIMVSDLRQMIKTLNDAITIIPLLKEYLDLGIRNDDQLLKLAAIVQGMMADKGGPETGGEALTEEERKQLMSAVEEATKTVPKPVVFNTEQ